MAIILSNEVAFPLGEDIHVEILDRSALQIIPDKINGVVQSSGKIAITIKYSGAIVASDPDTKKSKAFAVLDSSEDNKFYFTDIDAIIPRFSFNGEEGKIKLFFEIMGTGTKKNSFD